MSSNEKYSLILTGLYDLLTFCLVSFVAFETFIKPKIPKLSMSLQYKPCDTRVIHGNDSQFLDFVIINKGRELENVKIKSEPNEIGWDKRQGSGGKNTSEYFHSVIPFLGEGEKITFFWCDAKQNIPVISKPVRFIVEYDNPFFRWSRSKSVLKIDLSAFKGNYFGINNKYDIHSVAEELLRIRQQIENVVKLIEPCNQDKQHVENMEKK